MIPYPSIDPEIVRIGPLALRWYGLMYLLGFSSSYILVRYQVKKRQIDFPTDFLDSFYTFLIFGLILGARAGYVLFYNPGYYFGNPIEIFAFTRGGLSFHGGLIGSVLAGIWCCKRYKVNPWLASDLVIATAPIGLGLGRIGNFINGELYGRITAAPWGMVFPGAGPLPRHPSQLYEFMLEGVALFAVLWRFRDRVKAKGVLTGLFIALYGVVRFTVEFFREPDPQLGFIAGPFTMGQLLSSIMVIVGAVICYLRRSR